MLSSVNNANFTDAQEELNYNKQIQLQKLRQYDQLCQELIENSKSIDGYCHAKWDGLLCWPSIPPGTTQLEPCPDYVDGFNSNEFASRHCNQNGQWFIKDLSTNESWTNYTLCMTEYEHHADYTPLNVTTLHENLNFIRIISQIGYSSSFITLMTAFLILFSVKKLRCPRNKLHLHLFSSFMLRAWAVLSRGVIFYEANDKTIWCKMYTSFWHYTLMANYSWILMEGLYLHNLIFLTVFRDGGGIVPYVVMGWGLPWLFLIPWVIVKTLLEDEMCWLTNAKTEIFWIIRGPITTSIVLNFLIFINITRVLLMKMFLPQAPRMKRYKYRKWFKSTLVLVPLFGVHYAFTLGIYFATEFSHVTETIWLYIDQIFSSFQGFLVALLYCFLNGEVRSELKKTWQKWKSLSERFHSHTSLFTQSNTHISRNRGSVHSLQSNTISADKHELNPSPRHSTCAGGPNHTIINLMPASSTLSPSVITTLAGIQSHNSSIRQPKNKKSSTISLAEDSNSSSTASKDFNISTESASTSISKADRQSLSLPCNHRRRKRSFSTDEKSDIALSDFRDSGSVNSDVGLRRSKKWKSEAISPVSSDSSVCL